jgi:hypothetical protein
LLLLALLAAGGLALAHPEPPAVLTVERSGRYHRATWSADRSVCLVTDEPRVLTCALRGGWEWDAAGATRVGLWDGQRWLAEAELP